MFRQLTIVCSDFGSIKSLHSNFREETMHSEPLTVAEQAFSMCQYIQVKRSLLTHANEVGVRG